MKPHRSGFSLVLSLTVMASLVLMVVVLASFLQVESRLAQSQAGHMQARLNAIAAARIAIAQVQAMMGPDQRVSMRADLYVNDYVAPNGTGQQAVPRQASGDDRVVPNPNAPQQGSVAHNKRHWTGVWATGGVDSSKVRDWSVTDPHDSRLFLGWIVSPTRASQMNPDEIEPTSAGMTSSAGEVSIQNYAPLRTYYQASGKAVMTEGQRLIDGLSFNFLTPGGSETDANTMNEIAVPLVSRGTVAFPAAAAGNRMQQEYYGAVNAIPMPLPAAHNPLVPRNQSAPSGRFAYWVGDEGIKAKINLPDSYAHDTSGNPIASLTEWERGMIGGAAQRNAVELMQPDVTGASAQDIRLQSAGMPTSFANSFRQWRNADTGLELGSIASPAEAALWAKRRSGSETAAEEMRGAMRALWPDATTHSFSTLADVYSGGAKTDLSTAFELPYSVYRTLEMYPDQKRVVANSRQSFFHGAQGPVDLDFNRPNLVDKLGSAADLLRASPRASEWASRFVGPAAFTTLFQQIRTRNGNETPERLGFAYEVPIAPAFFNQTRLESTRVSATGFAQYDSLPWRGLLPDAPDNLMGRIVRGPTWDLYRNWYRIYKREVEKASADGGMRGLGAMNDVQSFAARGVEPLTYATGSRAAPIRSLWPQIPTDNGNQRYTNLSEQIPPNNPLPDGFYADNSAVIADRYFHRNNLADSNVQPLFQAERRRLIPYDLQQALTYAPSRINGTNDFTAAAGLQVPTVSSLASGAITPITDTRYAYNGAGTNSVAQTTRTQPTSPALMPAVIRFSLVYSAVRKNNQIGITVDPIIVLHNPYDAPIEFAGIAMVSNAANTPVRFTFQLDTGGYWSTERMYRWQWGPNDGTDVLKGVPHTQINIGSAGTPITYPGRYTNWRDWKNLSSAPVAVGDVVIGGGQNDNRSFILRVVAGSGGTGPSGSTVRLSPGEIRVISASSAAGSLDFSANKNVSIPGDTGFDLMSRAFYRMTPYANARSRSGTGERDSEKVLWNMDFIDCTGRARYNKGRNQDGSGHVHGAFTWNDFKLGCSDCGVLPFADITFGERLRDLWNEAQNARRLRDALTFTDPAGFNPTQENTTWDGTVASLESLLGGRTLRVVVNNSGWHPYNGMVIGSEGERITVDRTATVGGEPTLPESRVQLAGYQPASQRSGRLGTQGNQSWNFYLLGKQSIDNRNLNTHRRWFGTPDDRGDYISGGDGRTIRRFREGGETVNGFNLVDEDLLLNFQAMVTGWPMYSNSNRDDNYHVALDREWLERYGTTQPDPNYYIRGSWSALGLSVPTDPEFNELTGKAIELTNAKANTLNYSMAPRVNPGADKDEVFILDFARRAADMTGLETENRWLPENGSAPTFGNSPVVNNLDRMKTPDEMLRAPTTPFLIGHRAQQAQLFGYDGKAHAPLGWIQTQRTLNGSMAWANYPASGSFTNAFWGNSLLETNGGVSSVILYPLPRRPLLSLSQLGTAPTAEVGTDADLTVGASFAHPGIGDLTKILEWPGPRDFFPTENTPEFSNLHGSDASSARGPMPELGYVAKAMGTRPVRNRSAPRVDHAFASNLALWDGFYFSGLNLPANSYTPADTPSAWPSGPDLPTDTQISDWQKAALTARGVSSSIFTFTTVKAALESGFNPLANKRMSFIPDGRPVANLVTSLGTDRAQSLTETDFPHPKYLARNSLYNGGFNVNSTSKAAWKAVLGGLRGQPLPDITGNASSTTALTKFWRAIGGSGTNGSEPWTKHRELTDSQIDELAERVVAEVRGRGPFMSLADFINRRLINSEVYGLKGALQAAIDKADSRTNPTRNINRATILSPNGTFEAPTAPIPGGNWYDPNVILPVDPGTSTFGWRETSGYPKFDPKLRFPSIRSMSAKNDNRAVTAALGAAGVVTQMDILNSVGPNLTARSDTFVVRAYGEALDGAGQVIGKAWIEVVVQRSMQYMLPGANGATGDDPNRRRLDYRDLGRNYGTQPIVETYERNLPTGMTPSANAANLNRLLGRRFRTTSIRWLGANEI
jgi:hypothetical protein